MRLSQDCLDDEQAPSPLCWSCHGPAPQAEAESPDEVPKGRLPVSAVA